MFPTDTHIMLIDDMKAVRVLLRKILKDLGYLSVTEASDGVEGLSRIHEFHRIGNPVKLVISDYNMPNMTGLELLKNVRRDFTAPIPFVMLTAESERSVVANASKYGVDEYIIKPPNAAIFSNKLEMLWKKLNH